MMNSYNLNADPQLSICLQISLILLRLHPVSRYAAAMAFALAMYEFQVCLSLKRPMILVLNELYINFKQTKCNELT